MERNAFAYLEQWRQSKTRKPLVLRGARQVGKTWLLKAFGAGYSKCAYVNFESSSVLRTLFSGDLDIRRIITALQIETGVILEQENTLIILDEIQQAPGGLTSLKYFQETAPGYHIVSAGSFLGVARGGQHSFPVGKVDLLDLYPLDFSEFLHALGEQPLLDLLTSQDWTLIKTFGPRYIDLLKQYYYVGGMPEAVMSFTGDKDFRKVRDIQRRILTSYEQDLSKHAPNDIVPRIRMVWNSIPAQLAKDNRKFIYGLIRQGARAKEYELAISWLIDCGLVHRVNNVTKPAPPLKAYEDNSTFKLFLVDVGLLTAMTELDVKTLLEGSSLFEEFRGALTEQFVLQQLIANKDISLYYWSPENGRAEMDFLVLNAGHVLPLEVKPVENLKSKSLKFYHQKYQPKIGMRTSLSDHRREQWLLNVPLYAMGNLAAIISRS